MYVEVEAAFFKRFPALRVCLVEVTLEGAVAAQAVQAHWHQAWASFRALGLGRALEHPHVAAYRQALKAAGIRVNEHPPAIEALTRPVLKQEQPFCIHPVVDFYNGVCLQHVTPAGAFDLDALAADDLSLRLSKDGDMFTQAAGEEAVALPAGELGWFSGTVALSRHFIWRQSRQSLIGPQTRRLVLISEFVDGISDKVATAVTRALGDGARNQLGARTATHRLDVHAPSVRLGRA